MVKAGHSRAGLMHEAAIGSVDYPPNEIPMAGGMTADAAVDPILSGISRST